MNPGATTTSATVGRPRVNVPVLSSTTVSTRWAISSAAPPRMRIPASAPRPVPTMMAVGVARPIAHGHAMTTTPMKAVSASVMRGSGPNASHTRNVPAATTRTIGTKTSAIAIGQSLDRGLAALGPTHEVHDPGERGVAADARRPHHERAGRVEGRPDDLGAGAHLDRHGLAGQHAGVDRGPALDDDAVDGHPLPRPDAQQVTDDHRFERHVLVPPVAHEPGGLGPQPHEPPDRPGRAGLGAMLEPPTEQDEPDDDRRRVEVGLRVQPGLVDDLGKEGHEDAVQPGRARADRHERVHVGGAMTGGSPGSAVEPPARPDLDDRGRHEREPVDGLHRDAGLRHEHRDHDRDGDRDRRRRPREAASAPRARGRHRPRTVPRAARPGRCRRRRPVAPASRTSYPAASTAPTRSARPATSGR